MFQFAKFQIRSQQVRRILTLALGGSVGCLSLFGQSTTGYSGEAYGTRVVVAAGTTSISAGTTAATVLCTEKTGMSNSNSVTTVSLPPLASTGVIDTSVSSAANTTSGATSSTAISTVNDLSLLGGLVTADLVQSESSSISSSGTFSTSSTGTTFTNAKVLGIPIMIDVAPNTKITLPGLGFVIVNEQFSKVTSTSATLTVNALNIMVSESNKLGIPVGTHLIVAHAESSTLVNEGLLNGFGYGTSVSAGPIQAGPSAAVYLGCVGTNDQLVTNEVASIDVPGVLAAGVVHTTAKGTVTSTTTSGQVTASVAGANLLSGLLAATTIRADASASITGGTLSLSDTGSVFVGLSVAGHPEVGINPAPNTKVNIAGLGTLWLHRVIQTSDFIEVRMVELVVDAENSFGLPLNADVRISVAHVGVTH
jgi:hypothetical protein